MATAEPRFTRNQPDVRRRKLIEATAQCLAEFGHAGTSVRAVAAKAKVSPGLVAHHFQGIDDLIVATYDHVGRRVAEALGEAMEAAPKDAESQLRAFIEASFKPPVLDRDLLAIWLSFWSLVRRDPGVRKVHKKVYTDYRCRLEALIADIARARRFKIDAHLAALGFTAMLDGLWLELCLDPTIFSREDALRIAHAWVDDLIAGGFRALALRPR
ncbi:TetR family transcriptional regulator C-terminal domain-containing protein [Dongia deserti]|uniref:TetR family transcriptional regulator C-terminal domain-containing protein n=1 Tax=Dongia deserti TaxID=2268030 RepID=UPI000E6599D9|nr:TetR family transcriptional regulator C-terminal domain-containing protein [Dongia deserti]